MAVAPPKRPAVSLTGKALRPAASFVQTSSRMEGATAGLASVQRSAGARLSCGALKENDSLPQSTRARQLEASVRRLAALLRSNSVGARSGLRLTSWGSPGAAAIGSSTTNRD